MDELDGLTPEQARRLAKIRENMARRKRAEALTAETLRAMENSWRHDRLATIAVAVEGIDAGLLSLADVLSTLNLSYTSWWRRRGELTGRSDPRLTAGADRVGVPR